VSEVASTPERIAQFRIVGVLGRGGMGVVYRAQDESLRRDVALKVLPDAGDGERRQRFLREARSAAGITHPNVAVVHQVGEDAGRVYIAMELVAGESLRERLQRGPLEPAIALDVASQIARGLAAAHERGIVHRDLKPENVMITPDGVVKLLDFGLAKAGADRKLERGTEAALAETEMLVTSDQGRIMGTPEYMSPEQATGEALDVRSDVFSYGVVLYEMLAGARPFAGASTGAVLVAIARDAHRPLRERAPHVEERIAAIVETCLAKRPEERFANAGEVLAALGGQRSPRATTASRTDVAPVASNRPQGVSAKPVRAALAALVILALLAAGARWVLSRGAAPSASSTPSAVASTSPSAAADHAADFSRSTNAEAQHLYDEAMRSYHDGTEQAEALLDRAVQADPTFAAAYLRKWLIASKLTAQDDAHRHLILLESQLTPRERAIVDFSEDPEPASHRTKMDAYLDRFGGDCMDWVVRLGLATTDEDSVQSEARALSIDATCVPVLWMKASRLGRASPQDAMKVVDSCLAVSPHAIDCLGMQASLLDTTGQCESAEKSVRRWLEVDPDSSDARVALAGLLAGRGESTEAIREALGGEARASGGFEIPPETQLSFYRGDLAEAARIARGIAGTARPTAIEWEHFIPTSAAMLASTEAGDLKGAADLAADYLTRRSAWRDPCWRCEAVMAAAAARGGRMDAREAQRRIAQAFDVGSKKWGQPGDAWAMTYAYAAQTPSEAAMAVAKLDDLGVTPPSNSFTGATGRALFLGGRGERARTFLEYNTTLCSGVFAYALNWVHAHLYLGELDEQAGHVESACGHYAKILARWGHAKPRSVTADEVRKRSAKLGCDAQH